MAIYLLHIRLSCDNRLIECQCHTQFLILMQSKHEPKHYTHDKFKPSHSNVKIYVSVCNSQSQSWTTDEVFNKLKRKSKVNGSLSYACELNSRSTSLIFKNERNDYTEVTRTITQPTENMVHHDHNSDHRIVRGERRECHGDHWCISIEQNIKK